MPERSTSRDVRVLFIEDNEDDLALNQRALRAAGFAIQESVCVQTREDLVAALKGRDWDLILSDYAMPSFSGPHALAAVQELGVDIPFIVVSGTVGEDTAVEVMRQGAQDYVLKGRLTRLGPAIERELRAAARRREQAAAEANMRFVEERDRVLLANSSDAISIIDLDGVFQHVTPPIEAITGYRPDEIIGRRVGERLDPEQRARLIASIGPLLADARAGRGESPPVSFELSMNHKDGSPRYIDFTVRNFVNNPTIRGLVGTARDVSQRRAAEEERRARLQAELVSRMKSAFLASMSHELRTPLNAIIGFSELMEQGIGGTLPPKHVAFVGNVLQAGRHLLRVVNDILDLSKVEAGKLTLDREWTVLGDVLTMVQDSLAPLAQQANISLETTVAHDLPEIYVDPARLRQIFYNLLSNGIKFSRPGGTVRVDARLSGRGVQVTVTDNGIGIAAADLPRLFKEFERMKPANEGSPTEGTGLGLALTKKLVELHGGTIAATSEVGVGSCFTISLPDVRRPTRAPEITQLAPRSSAKVLVVDDDADARALIGQQIRALGCEPIHAEDAESTIRLAATERPALITLDILMPNIDGWAILECLRQDHSTADIPVAIISVLDDRSRSLSLGAIEHLTKPVSREDLHRVLSLAGVTVRPTSLERST